MINVRLRHHDEDRLVYDGEVVIENNVSEDRDYALICVGESGGVFFDMDSDSHPEIVGISHRVIIQADSAGLIGGIKFSFDLSRGPNASYDRVLAVLDDARVELESDLLIRDAAIDKLGDLIQQLCEELAKESTVAYVTEQHQIGVSYPRVDERFPVACQISDQVGLAAAS